MPEKLVIHSQIPESDRPSTPVAHVDRGLRGHNPLLREFVIRIIKKCIYT